jgi:hypothetical protein
LNGSTTTTTTIQTRKGVANNAAFETIRRKLIV